MLFEHGFQLDKAYLGPELLHEVTGESVATLTDRFADYFVSENVACVYDVRKFVAEAILFREILCKKRDILMFK